MVKVVGVRFKRAGKIYYFRPGNFYISLGDFVIVETIRGLELGKCVICDKDLEESKFTEEMKFVIRIADSTDLEIYRENKKRAMDALDICKVKVKDHGLEMKMIDCEYTFDKSKVIFYFTADNRIDFRELVKDLANIFKARIELRQIGVRDHAKMVGCIGQCGQEACCCRFLGSFSPVSIKMAKDQNMSLNPTNISGSCGRLMCCLNYECETYQENLKGMPKTGYFVKTPEGRGQVTEINALMKRVKVKIKDENDNISLEEYALDQIDF